MNTTPQPSNNCLSFHNIFWGLCIIFQLFVACHDEDSSLSSERLPLPPLDFEVEGACNDGVDNDQDEKIDFPADPGCLSAFDIDERDPVEMTECNDQLDNDNDGLVDQNDPGCELSDGVTEENAPQLPQCSNGIDDDGDGYVDYPIDDSCLTPEDDDESFMVELTACNNQRDDDADGLIDFPFDPGCASAQDLDERDDTDASMIAQCNDGVDNDQEGYADLADPQCATATDPRERLLDDEAIAVCSNGLDDDGDGLIDAQEDPGCLGPGAASEENQAELAVCADGLDNDSDGYIDYPHDPGCTTLGSMDETNPRIPPACLDGEDNDQDGYIDFPNDPGCDSSADISEEGVCLSSAKVIELVDGQIYRGSSRQGRFYRQGSCGGRGAPELTAIYQVHERVRRLIFQTKAIEGEEDQGWETTLYTRKRCDESQLELACHREPSDGVAFNELIIEDPPLGPLYLLIDGASGQGGTFELKVTEVPIEACQNTEDDDGDGLVDYPIDPGCESSLDPDETSPDPLPACANGLDDDADALVDFPDDIGCSAAFDNNELDECGQGIPLYQLNPAPSSFTGISRIQGRSSEYTASCGGTGIEQVLRYDNPSHAQLSIELYRTDGISEPAYLYAKMWECQENTLELGCASQEIGERIEVMEDDEEELSPEVEQYGAPLTLELPSVPQGVVYLFIDHDLDGFPFLLKVKRIPLTPLCSDGADNDQDGLSDHHDPGCSSPEDEDERDPLDLPICADGQDNDIDGWTDFPLDPGCAYRGGASEEDPEELPSCINGIDDNADGFTDFPEDIGCASRGDDSESNLPIPPRCSNLRDDDEDGVIDFPYDPGCVARGDDDEQDPPQRPHCSDGIDNDQNGSIDYPFDAGCYAMGDPREQATAIPSECSDQLDNDQDGFIDLPYDPGCESSGDNSEVDPLLTPQCANGLDDDENGRIDWPDDPGCITELIFVKMLKEKPLHVVVMV